MAATTPFQLLPETASASAHASDVLSLFVLAVCGFFFLMIFLLIVWFSLKYRRRSEDEVPQLIEGSTLIEIVWMVLPFGLLVVMFVWGSRLYLDMKHPPAHAMQIDVIGKQWMWKVQHPGGQREIDALHVPTGTPVKLVMTSQDVIHDFSLPAFRINQDVLPGSFTSEWFIATRPGSYHLFCSEYCGTSHSQMVGTVTVMTPEDYQSWLAGVVPDERPADAGARLFVSYGCVQCHSKIAPTMAGLYNSKVSLSDGTSVIADEDYLRESILEPAAKIVAGYAPAMPSYSGRLSDEQLMQLVAFIKELASATTQPADYPDSHLPLYELPNLPPANRPPSRGQP